ncbi:hypothetical protein FO519_005421 [Halicephalobus sp. NKZ332]|nr:hypothetical protein FO519_005421 [Halicephalobus sp. NKZ332]
MSARNQGDHAREILRYFSEARREEFPDLETLGNAFGLLSRFVVLSGNEEILKTTIALLKKVFEDTQKSINEILNNEFDGTSSYILSADYGQFPSMQNIGKENIVPDVKRFIEFGGRKKKRNRDSFISPPDIPKLHQLYYGFVQRCSNPLDLLVIQMKMASVISFSLGVSDPWMEVLEVFKVSNRPDFDNIDEKNVKILENWCSLIRATIAGKCNKLCAVCIDAFMPPGHGTLNQRIAMLISLATKCVVLDKMENINVKVLVLFGDKLTQIEEEGFQVSSTFEICLGEALETDFLYEISSIFAFKGVLSPQCAVVSKSLGCESQCLTECRNGGLLNCFSQCMTKNFIVNKNCGLLDVWSEPRKFVSRLQRNVLFVIQASSAHCYGLSVLQKGVDSDKLNRIGESVLCLTMYKDFPIEWHCPIIYRKQTTLDIALRAIGSIKIFIFLYALSVDKKYDEDAQLEALKLLFKALRRTPLYYGEFRAANGLHMLTQIFNTEYAHFNEEIFEEVCKFIFTELEKKKDLDVSFYTVISEPDFLKILISTTDLWKRDNFKFWIKLIKLTAKTIDNSKVKFAEFNSQLLHRVDFLKPLLHGLLDMQKEPDLFFITLSRKNSKNNGEDFIRIPKSTNDSGSVEDYEEDYIVITRSLVNGICAIVSELISSPFRCSGVLNLWNFILLSHPAQDTYLDFSLNGHSEWIKLDEIESEEDEKDDFEPHGSLLSSFFEKVLMNFDKDKIADFWSKKNSVTDVRKEILKTQHDFRVFKNQQNMRLDSITYVNNQQGHIDQEFSNPITFPARKVDHWLTVLRTDLLSNMCNIILSCEDSLMAVIELDVLSWKTIVVQLTNQYDKNIRNLIFVLLQNFFLRCAEKYKQEFIKQHGFLLLGNQLKKYSKIFETNNLLRRAMIDCGIVDTMVNVLRVCCVKHADMKAIVGPVFPLVECWMSFSRSIINLVIPYRDPYMYSRAEDFLWLCQIADYQLSNPMIDSGPTERLRKLSNMEVSPNFEFSDFGKKLVRRAFCQLIETWMDSIQCILMEGNYLIPVDERLDQGQDSNSDESAFEIYYGDSEFTSSSYYGNVRRNVNLDYQYGMKISLHELALCPQYEPIWDEYAQDLDKLIRFLRTLQLESPLANLTREEIRSLTTDEVILLHTYSTKRGLYAAILKENALRLATKDNSLIKAVKDHAIALTCTIAELQNEPRKFYMQSRKNSVNACAKANEVLASLVVELCHPEAPFYDEGSWPRGFSLDPTENSHRERKRLKPDHYRFDLKFLKKSRQNEIGLTYSNPYPLKNLCESCPNFATTDYIEASNHSTEDRNGFVEQLKRMGLGGLIADEKQELKNVTESWRKGNLTNFDYLMILNKLAGRSFNDLMQYPVFPFILANYTSMILDLNSNSSFRDLSRPMAIQNRMMEEYYVHNYTSLFEENERHRGEKDSFFSSCFGAYHYEFFFLQEMFCNKDKLNLGVKQAGSEVDDVILPTWCPENNPRIFCLIHRQALESQYVTNNLHLWIDLIFGFKQQGQAAVKAINVFHPATYRGRDLEDEEGHDEISLSALRTMVKTYGQMPNQLFLSPHLPHLNSSKIASGQSKQFLMRVKGLRWGDFVGSPDLDKRQWISPSLSIKIGSHDAIGRLVQIQKEGICYGLPDKTELILRKNMEKDLKRNSEITTAIVSWKFSDNVLRIKLVQMNDSVWINLIDLQMFEPTQVVFSPNTDLLYIGTSCGLIRVYLIDYRSDSKIWYVKLINEFFAHKSSISSLRVCDDFHIVLSTSIDAMACLWDSNQLTYIRTLKPNSSGAEETITLTAISSISADIAIVYQSGRGSRLVLFTVNGDIIGTYATGPELTILSLSMTNMEEGTGINCIAIGLQNGIIRLLESWTLSLVCDINSGFVDPVISIEFTYEARRLYAALASGNVLFPVLF